MIAGIVKRKKSELNLPLLSKRIQNAINPMKLAERSAFWMDHSALLCSALRVNSPASHWDDAPFVGEGEKIILVYWGRLTNRRELSTKLGLDESLSRIPDTKLIYLSFLKWSQEFIHHLYGDFTLAIYDTVQKELLCCSDHMGSKPFYYYMDDEVFLFASSLAVFHDLNIAPMNPDLSWAAKYILGLSMDFEYTAYSGIFKLPPAHILTIKPDQHKKIQYFSFNGEDKLAGVSIEECLEHYKSLLDDAVKSRIKTNYPLGSETSGGIDSSTVTALAATYFTGNPGDFHTFGFALQDEEPALLLQISQKYKIAQNHIFCARPGMMDQVMERSLKVMGYPYEHGNAVFHHPFYEECEKNGIRTLLSGFGGDEFVTTIHGNIIISELIRDRKYADLYTKLRGNKLTAFLRLIKQILKQKFSSSEEYCPRFLQAWNERWPYQPLRNEVVTAYDLKKAYFDTAKFDAGYTDLNRFTLEKRFEPFVPTRMNNCSQMALSYGIDYAWPLLDVRLISYFLSIPTEYKLGKMGRYFHRLAMDGIVPDPVNWKPSKDMGGFAFHPLEARETTELNEYLHPDLHLLIDPDEVRKKRDAANRSKGSGKIFLGIQIANINHLDLWLKKFHPNGASWANPL